MIDVPDVSIWEHSSVMLKAATSWSNPVELVGAKLRVVAHRLLELIDEVVGL